MNEILEFLNDVKTFYFASVDGDQPKVRPFAFFMEFEGKLYFGTNETKPSFEQLKANPKFELSATNAKMEWIRLSGKAVFDYRPEVKAQAFKAAPYLEGMYGKEGSPVLALFYASEGKAEFCSMTSAPKIVKF